MKIRLVLILLAMGACLGSVWAVLAQRQELAALRAQRDALTIPSADLTERAAANNPGNKTQSTAPLNDPDSQELLRLRSEVTRLTASKRALSGIADENARLRGQLENSRTNTASGNPLPSSYMLKAHANMVGYSTPENAFQSFLWALRNHDLTNLLQALTPASAQKLQARFQDPGQATAFIRDMDAMPGLSLQSRKDMPDGSIQFEMEVIPGIPLETVRAQPINGEWKLDLPF